MNEIKERFGVNVIGKGMYQAPGKTLPLGERPLYLFVEGEAALLSHFVAFDT